MSIDPGNDHKQHNDHLAIQNQVGDSDSIVRKIERISKKSLWGYRGDDLVPFLKLTISNAANLPKVRDEYFFLLNI